MLELPKSERRLSPGAFLLSGGLHLFVIAVLLYRPEPRLLQPTATLRGNGGNVSSLLSNGPGSSVIYSTVAKELESERAAALRHPKNQQHARLDPKPAVADQNLKPGMPGYILGSLANGLPSDHDVRVALPVVAPDPPIVRAKLPDWIRGDIVVEVTIDRDGIVTDTRVLQTVGYGLESVVVETLRRWRFTPARVDGMTVASRQDVYFHFPS